MEKVEYIADEQPVDEQESSFDVMNIGDSVKFSDYEDPRESNYTESFEFPEAMVETNDILNPMSIDSVYDDDLEQIYGDYADNDNYNKIRMKKDRSQKGNDEDSDGYSGGELSENIDDGDILYSDSVEDYDSYIV